MKQLVIALGLLLCGLAAFSNKAFSQDPCGGCVSYPQDSCTQCHVTCWYDHVGEDCHDCSQWGPCRAGSLPDGMAASYSVAGKVAKGKTFRLLKATKGRALPKDHASQVLDWVKFGNKCTKTTGAKISGI